MLKNKVAVITGGGGVLCRAFALALAEKGVRVALLDLNAAAAESVAEEIRARGGDAIGVTVNVLDKASLINAKEAVEKAFGTCDILINGAGGNHPKGTTTKDYLYPKDLTQAEESVKTFFDLDQDGISFVFNLNFLGALLTTQVFAASMVDKEGATVINVSSMNAFTPLTRIPAYSGAKAAVSNLTQWLAVHFCKVGIRVNAIAPGFFLTNQNRGLLLQEDGSWSARAEKILSQTPMGRFGAPEELNGTLLWLADNEVSGFVNGVVVPVDGGFSAYSGV